LNWSRSGASQCYALGRGAALGSEFSVLRRAADERQGRGAWETDQPQNLAPRDRRRDRQLPRSRLLRSGNNCAPEAASGCAHGWRAFFVFFVSNLGRCTTSKVGPTRSGHGIRSPSLERSIRPDLVALLMINHGRFEHYGSIPNTTHRGATILADPLWIGTPLAVHGETHERPKTEHAPVPNRARRFAA